MVVEKVLGGFRNGSGGLREVSERVPVVLRKVLVVSETVPVVFGKVLVVPEMVPVSD